MGKCKYKFPDREGGCKEDSIKNSEHCVIHLDFPKDEKSSEFPKGRKKQRIQEDKGTKREKGQRKDEKRGL
jgi:hypothetical protein